MKKIILSAAVVVALVSTSCTKDHTCTCTVTPTSGPTETVTTVYHSSTKANAALYCQGQATQTTTSASGTTVTGSNTTCTLK